jgi:hypothetical protein
VLRRSMPDYQISDNNPVTGACAYKQTTRFTRKGYVDNEARSRRVSVLLMLLLIRVALAVACR